MKKIFWLEERLNEYEIESSIYQTRFKKFKQDKAILESEINGSQLSRLNNDSDIIERISPFLSRLHDIYDKGNITQKQTLTRGVFKDNLTWGDGAFRTAFTTLHFMITY